MRQKTVITKLLKSITEVYYKVRQVLQSVTDCYYKVHQVLQSVTDCYYKVHQVLQSATVITEQDITTVPWPAFWKFFKKLPTHLTPLCKSMTGVNMANMAHSE